MLKKLLFVCMGNSCSSPMAEAIMKDLMDKTSLYWKVDSAGLRPWNTGRRADKRCQQTLREHGLQSDHFCRQFTADDFLYFDFIVAMNEAVYKKLLVWGGFNRDVERDSYSILLLSSFGKSGQPAIIRSLSPTHKLRSFRKAYYQIKECCKRFILSQKVDIICYELPSTEEDDFAPLDLNLATKSTSSQSANLSSSSNPTAFEVLASGTGSTTAKTSVLHIPDIRCSGGASAIAHLPRTSTFPSMPASSCCPGATRKTRIMCAV
ncbi:hypothetical protein KR018_010678 [Drosophila ironensis]|nr:hypothetical protein KR018_010678 [Drosophila ironensis]